VNKQVLLDKLSEFLMVEQCGWQLYRVVGSRATDKELKERYQEFGQETDRHRTILTSLIRDLGGDPDYVSPTARVAQAKSEALLQSALVSAKLPPAQQTPPSRSSPGA
jgi:rubrerythrin